MADRYDAIIIGAGHNGLVCGSLLAKAGKKVLILEAKDLFVRISGEEHANVARTWHSLAKVYTDSGQLVRAEEACRRALDLHLKIMRPDHRDTGPPCKARPGHEFFADLGRYFVNLLGGWNS